MLAELVAARRELELRIDHEIDRLVVEGAGWPVIADALDVSRQAARQRYTRRRGVEPRVRPDSRVASDPGDSHGLVGDVRESSKADGITGQHDRIVGRGPAAP
jgi:hypothetical protein